MHFGSIVRSYGLLQIYYDENIWSIYLFQKLREELLIMKKYLLLCAEAMNKKFLLLLQSRQHFVDTSDVYSMQDFLDILSDSLLAELAQIHAQWAQHIKTDCQVMCICNIDVLDIYTLTCYWQN